MKETLEEAAENYYLETKHRTPSCKKHFIEGAKWQAERMYSEDFLLEFANYCRIEDNKYPNRVITIQQLFSQFKK